MGRRKIEIQPITHERNRSVTFLKRKNGLFKKAYELGVLCSVDVAVIIFEERPGHQRKLYQYCSSDVQSIVQQHLRHDGERDTRGPGDFSGIASAKNDDGGDADEDDGEEDDDDIPSTKKRTRGETSSIAKLRPPHAQDNMMDADMDYNSRLSHNHAQSSFGIPHSIAHAISSHHTSHSSHPMSSDRLRPARQYQNKPTKLEMHDHGVGARGHGHNTEDPNAIGGGNEYTFPPPSSSSFRHPQHPHSTSPSASSLHQVSYGNPQYNQGTFFSGAPTQPVQPSSFMHSQSEMSSSRARSFTSPAGSTAFSPQSRTRPSTTTSGGGGTGDILAAYLDTDPSNTRRPSGGPGAGGPTTSAFGIDWPGHSSSSGASTTSPSTATSTSSVPGNPGSHWLDFLSGNGNAPPAAQGHAQSNSTTSTPVPPSVPRTASNTPKLSPTQSMGWAPQQRSRPDPSASVRNSGVTRSASGEGVSIDVEQLFGGGAARAGEVKKEG